MPSREWRKNAVRFSQLDEIQRRLRRLEKSMTQNDPGADAP